MTNDDIQKLLGGYATNTLTESERKALFEAALDNQELFDALGQEQALKELLADPVSREQVRRALDQPVAARHVPWWSRPWAWGGTLSAVAAAVMIVAVVRFNQPRQTVSLDALNTAATPPAPSRASETPPRTAEPKPPVAALRRSKPRMSATTAAESSGAAPAVSKESKDELAVAAPPPPPPPATNAVQSSAVQNQNQAAQNQAQNQSPAQNQAQNQAAASAVNTFRDGAPAPPAAGFGGSMSGYRLQPLPYFLVKRDANGAYSPVSSNELKPGDAIRLTVSPTVPGYLTLSELDASGAWKRVLPQTGPGMLVRPNTTYTIPDSAIEITSKEEKFRLMLLPAAQEMGQLEKRSDKKTKAAAPPAANPLILDITLGAKKAP